MTLCCFDTAEQTPQTRAANALRLSSDKPVSKPWAIPPRVNHNVFTVLHASHYVLAGYDGWWWSVVNISICFVTGRNGRYVYLNMYATHSLFCQTVTDDLCAWARIHRHASACVCVHMSENTDSREQQQQQQLLGVWSCLSTRRSCLEGDELSRVREGGTGFVRALLASLSSGRCWE